MICPTTSKIKVSGVLAVLVLLIASRGTPTGSAIPGNSSNPPAPAGACVSAIQQTYDNMNKTTAIANALASSSYSDGVASYYNPTFNSIFQIDKTISKSTCQEQVESYNVVFVLHNSSGLIVANLVISETQDLAILGASIQPDKPTNTYTANNAGYEVYYTGGSTDYIYSTYTEYTQPTPGYPTTPSSCANGGACYVNSWTGIGTGPYNSGAYVAQAGTSAWCDEALCTDTNGGRGYSAWYEIVAPSGPTVTCGPGFGGSVTIDGGDTIYTYTINNYYSGGPGGDQEYTFNIEDMTSSTSCYVDDVSDNGYDTGPTYAYYITEIPYECSGGCTLAPFTRVDFTSATYNDYNAGTNYGVDHAYNAGDYVEDYMENGILSGSTCTNVVQNVISGTPSSGGDFDNSWNSSANTPGGCQP